MQDNPLNHTATNFDPNPVVIHHTLKGALGFGILILAMMMASIAVFWYLLKEGLETIPVPILVIFIVVYAAALFAAKRQFVDAGKVALTIGPKGVKFDCYHLIRWQDIEGLHIEENDGADSLWLSVKEGVTILKNGPRPLKGLARISGLHRNINITGYGSLSMKDEDIRLLIEKWLHHLNMSENN